MPETFTSFDAPVRAGAELAVMARQDPARGGVTFTLRQEESRAVVSWREGELGLQGVLAPVRLAPGLVRYEGGVARLERLAASLESLTATASGELTGGILSATPGPLRFTGNATAAGRLQELIFYLGHEVRLPELPPDLDGQMRLELQAGGATDALRTPEYELRLTLDQVHAAIPSRWRQIPVRELSAEVVLTPQRGELRRLAALVDDPEHGQSRLEMTGILDRSGCAWRCGRARILSSWQRCC
jgi:hypothetical protein